MASKTGRPPGRPRKNPPNPIDTMEFIDMDDPENWRGSNQGKGIKEIALEHYNRCLLSGSKEMHPGGEKEQVVDGKVRLVNVENTSQIFCNHVRMLWTVMLPSIYDDLDFKKTHALEVKESERRLKVWMGRNKERISEMRKKPKKYSPKYQNDFVRKYNLLRDDKLVEHYQLTFEKLSLLLSKKNYFEEKTFMA